MLSYPYQKEAISASTFDLLSTEALYVICRPMAAASLSEPALRVVLASVRCILDLYSNQARTNDQYETFFFIALPVSTAFLSVMVGDILALKKFRSSQKLSGANRGVMALLNGFEAWQMISICHFEESRPLAQLFVCVCLVLAMKSLAKFPFSQLFSAFFVLFCFCYEHEPFNFQKHGSGVAIILYASVAMSCTVTRSIFLKYCLHLCIIFVDFYHHDCMLSGMILMIAVSRIGLAIAMSYDTELSGGLPAPCTL